jgi:hypothetical protein
LTFSRTATVIGDGAFLGDEISPGEGAFPGDGRVLEEDGVFTMMSLIGVAAAGPNGEAWSYALALGLRKVICGTLQFVNLKKIVSSNPFK